MQHLMARPLSRLLDLLTERLRPPRTGGPLGTPSHDLDEAPPSVDQEANAGVSGDGVVGSRGAPSRKARRTPA